MPEYVVNRISSVLNERAGKSFSRSTILILGVAYKRDIRDIRESPALDVISLLEGRGCKVVYNDPYIPQYELDDRVNKSVNLTAATVKKADLVAIITDHTSYDYQWVVDNARLVFDARNATKRVIGNRKKIILL